ncbi:MAG: cation:proton antiporter [Candidatus Aenigmatarchaeota archaeon]
MTAVDPLLLSLVLVTFVALIIGAILQFFRQPSVIAYILTGIILGPFGLGLVTDSALISNLGSFGVVLLLFFVGMKISLPQLVLRWRIAILGTLFQIFLSLALVFALGDYLGCRWGEYSFSGL